MISTLIQISPDTHMPNSSVSSLNYQSQLIHARQSIELALEHCNNPVVSTKFSPHSAVFLHLVSEHLRDIPVIWVDTGYNSRDTVQFSHKVTQQLSLNLNVFEPDNHVIRIPPALDDPEHAAFSNSVKFEPFKRALKQLKADTWLSSVRRYQTAHRQSMTMFEINNVGLMKVSPLLNWTEEHVERYLQEHQLPLGPNCYDPTKGEPFRECGLHVQLAQ